MNTTDLTDAYGLFYKHLFFVSYSITKDVQLAEDVIQETFIKAIKKMESIEEISKVGAWLSVIATRTAIDCTRKEGKRNGIPVDLDMLNSIGIEMNQNVEEEVEAALLLQEVKHAIGDLSYKYRDVLLLKIDQGLRDSEIAHLLDLKLCTVKTRIYRGRKQLEGLFQIQTSDLGGNATL